jgi:hypothetical protein
VRVRAGGKRLKPDPEVCLDLNKQMLEEVDRHVFYGS